VHTTHMGEPSKTVPLYPLHNNGLFLAAVEDYNVALAIMLLM